MSHFSSPLPAQGSPAPAPTSSVASTGLSPVCDVFLVLGSPKWDMACRVGGENCFTSLSLHSC